VWGAGKGVFWGVTVEAKCGAFCTAGFFLFLLSRALSSVGGVTEKKRKSKRKKKEKDPVSAPFL
jgi:hypothetical protein